MMADLLDTAGKRFLGLVTGLAFGALLQRGRLTRSEVIVDQLLVRDGRVAKTMASAVLVGAAGVHALAKRGRVAKDIKPMKVGGVLGGAVLFGTGLALAEYCPGTSVAAAGEGKGDAVLVIAGMLAGAAAFVRFYPRVAPALEAGGDFGKKTLPGTVPGAW